MTRVQSRVGHLSICIDRRQDGSRGVGGSCVRIPGEHVTASVSLLFASGCGGDDTAAPSQVLSDAGAPGNDGASEAAVALTDASTADTSPPDAGADAKADAQLAFDTFAVGDQGAIVTSGTIQGVTSHGIRIVEGSGGFFCGGTGLMGQPSIELNVATTAVSLTPGTYPITNGTGATMRSEATFQMLDNQCQSLASHAAQSGSITITSMDATSVKGTYDISFAGLARGGHAIGGFIAPICNAASWGPKANCQP